MVIAVAALLAQSLRNLKTRPAGFDPANVLLFDVDIYGASLTQAELRQTYFGVLEQLQGLPWCRVCIRLHIDPDSHLQNLREPGESESHSLRQYINS